MLEAVARDIIFFSINIITLRASLAVQWLRLHASTAGDAGSFWGQGGQRSHVPHGMAKYIRKITLQ